MNWHERMNAAIAYVECNLSGEIELDRVAQIAGQSLTGFQRTFSVVTEMPISEYIRRRRMSLAGLELQAGSAKVIDIALKYGYDSPDAFTRAFKEIYGVSPSVARNGGFSLQPFPRISFLLTIKGEVRMDMSTDRGGVRIVNTYYEQMPALRLIGKRYTSADKDSDMWFDSKWNDWFQNGWFDQLFENGTIPGHENTGIMAFHKAAEAAWWICVFAPTDAPVPAGFDYLDLPAGIVGMNWICGYRHTKEIFSMETHDLCLKKWSDTGNTVKAEFDGVPGKWSFERYDNTRFFRPDSEGKVILDYGVYLDESEMSQQALLSMDATEHPVIPPEKSEDKPGIFAEPPQVCITDVAPYAVDAESNLLFCALSTLFLRLENIGEATPFFCLKHRCICNDCGDCGDMANGGNLARHHLRRYHTLLTVTGVGRKMQTKTGYTI